MLTKYHARFRLSHFIKVMSALIAVAAMSAIVVIVMEIRKLRKNRTYALNAGGREIDAVPEIVIVK